MNVAKPAAKVTKSRGVLNIFAENWGFCLKKIRQNDNLCFFCPFPAIYAFNFAVMRFMPFMLFSKWNKNGFRGFKIRRFRII